MPVEVSGEPMAEVACVINGEAVSARVPVRQSLVEFIRHGIGLTGSHVGCEHGVCGACNVIVNSRVVRGCLMLAVQAQGQTITTIESPQPSAAVEALQAAFYRYAAAQCGFCTPGMIMQASELLTNNPQPSRQQIRDALSGNYCRCTGYNAIVDAVESAAAALHKG